MGSPDAIPRPHPVCEAGTVSTTPSSTASTQRAATSVTDPKVSKGNWANGEECLKALAPAKYEYCHAKWRYGFDKKIYCEDKNYLESSLLRIKGYENILFNSNEGTGRAAANLFRERANLSRLEDQLLKDWDRLVEDAARLEVDKARLNEKDKKLIPETP
jgi:hypothetical protein